MQASQLCPSRRFGILAGEATSQTFEAGEGVVMTTDILRNTKILKHVLMAVLVISLSPLVTGDAAAQLTPWRNNSNVLVDPALLGDRIGRQVPVRPLGISPYSPQQGVQAPPARMPRSQLLTPRAPGTGTAAARARSLPRVKLLPPAEAAKRAKARRTARAKARAKPRTPVARRAPAKAPAKKLAIAKPARPLAPTPPKAQMAPKPPTPPTVAKKTPPPMPAAPAVTKRAPAKKTASAVAPPQPPNIAKPKPAPKPPAVAKAAPRVQQAARTAAPTGPGKLRAISFGAALATVSASQKRVLDSVAAQMKSAQNQRLQLMAYAGEDNLSASKARRLSLSRALAVRSYLISKGVRSTRIDVRALGNKLPDGGGTPSRVDLRVLQR